MVRDKLPTDEQLEMLRGADTLQERQPVPHNNNNGTALNERKISRNGNERAISPETQEEYPKAANPGEPQPIHGVGQPQQRGERDVQSIDSGISDLSDKEEESTKISCREENRSFQGGNSVSSINKANLPQNVPANATRAVDENASVASPRTVSNGIVCENGHVEKQTAQSHQIKNPPFSVTREAEPLTDPKLSLNSTDTVLKSTVTAQEHPQPLDLTASRSNMVQHPRQTSLSHPNIVSCLSTPPWTGMQVRPMSGANTSHAISPLVTSGAQQAAYFQQAAMNTQVRERNTPDGSLPCSGLFTVQHPVHMKNVPPERTVKTLPPHLQNSAMMHERVLNSEQQRVMNSEQRILNSDHGALNSVRPPTDNFMFPARPPVIPVQEPQMSWPHHAPQFPPQEHQMRFPYSQVQSVKTVVHGNPNRARDKVTPSQPVPYQHAVPFSPNQFAPWRAQMIEGAHPRMLLPVQMNRPPFTDNGRNHTFEKRFEAPNKAQFVPEVSEYHRTHAAVPQALQHFSGPHDQSKIENVPISQGIRRSGPHEASRSPKIQAHSVTNRFKDPRHSNNPLAELIEKEKYQRVQNQLAYTCDSSRDRSPSYPERTSKTDGADDLSRTAVETKSGSSTPEQTSAYHRTLPKKRHLFERREQESKSPSSSSPENTDTDKLKHSHQIVENCTKESQVCEISNKPKPDPGRIDGHWPNIQNIFNYRFHGPRPDFPQQNGFMNSPPTRFPAPLMHPAMQNPYPPCGPNQVPQYPRQVLQKFREVRPQNKDPQSEKIDVKQKLVTFMNEKQNGRRPEGDNWNNQRTPIPPHVPPWGFFPNHVPPPLLPINNMQWLPGHMQNGYRPHHQNIIHSNIAPTVPPTGNLMPPPVFEKGLPDKEQVHNSRTGPPNVIQPSNSEDIVLNAMHMSGVEGVVLNVNFAPLNHRDIGPRRHRSKSKKRKSELVPENVFLRAKERRKRLELLPTPEALAMGENQPEFEQFKAADNLVNSEATQGCDDVMIEDVDPNLSNAGQMVTLSSVVPEHVSKPQNKSEMKKYEAMAEMCIASLLQGACADRENRKCSEGTKLGPSESQENDHFHSTQIHMALPKGQDASGAHDFQSSNTEKGTSHLEGNLQMEPIHPNCYKTVQSTYKAAKVSRPKASIESVCETIDEVVRNSIEGRQSPDNLAMEYENERPPCTETVDCEIAPYGETVDSERALPCQTESERAPHGEAMEVQEICGPSETAECERTAYGQNVEDERTQDNQAHVMQDNLNSKAVFFFNDVSGMNGLSLEPISMGTVEVCTEPLKEVDDEVDSSEDEPEAVVPRPETPDAVYAVLKAMIDRPLPEEPQDVDSESDAVESDEDASLADDEDVSDEDSDDDDDTFEEDIIAVDSDSDEEVDSSSLPDSEEEDEDDEVKSETDDSVDLGLITIGGKEYKMRIVADEDESSTESEATDSDREENEQCANQSLESKGSEGSFIFEGVDSCNVELYDDDDVFETDQSVGNALQEDRFGDVEPRVMGAEEVNQRNWGGSEFVVDEDVVNDNGQVMPQICTEQVHSKSNNGTLEVYDCSELPFKLTQEEFETADVEVDGSIAHQVDIEFVREVSLQAFNANLTRTSSGGFGSGLESEVRPIPALSPLPNLDISDDSDAMPQLTPCGIISDSTPMTSPCDEPPVLQYVGKLSCSQQKPPPTANSRNQDFWTTDIDNNIFYKTLSIKLRGYTSGDQTLESVNNQQKVEALYDEYFLGNHRSQPEAGTSLPSRTQSFDDNSVHSGSSSLSDNAPQEFGIDHDISSSFPNQEGSHIHSPGLKLNDQLSASSMCYFCHKNGRIRSQRIHTADETCPYSKTTNIWRDASSEDSSSESSDLEDYSDMEVTADLDNPESRSSECRIPCFSQYSPDEVSNELQDRPTFEALDTQQRGDSFCQFASPPEAVCDPHELDEMSLTMTDDLSKLSAGFIARRCHSRTESNAHDSDDILNRIDEFSSDETNSSYIYRDDNGCDDILNESTDCSVRDGTPVPEVFRDLVDEASSAESETTEVYRGSFLGLLSESESCSDQEHDFDSHIGRLEPDLGVSPRGVKCWVDLCDIGHFLEGKSRVKLSDFMTYNDNLCHLPPHLSLTDTQVYLDKPFSKPLISRTEQEHKVDQLKNILKEMQRQVNLTQFS